jgi:hypothetical protein
MCAVLVFAFLGIVYGRTQTIGFDDALPGELQPGLADQMNHTGTPPLWEIIRDDSAPSRPNVLAQLSADRTAGRFPLAILNRISLQDGSLSVCFKPVSGVVDQAAGIVWRYRDPGNYYIVRANALENNVVLYKVETGSEPRLPRKGFHRAPTA